MNNFFAQIQIAFKSLMQQRSRTILTIIAVAIGIGSLITMISAGNGLKSMVLKQLEVYGSNVINIEARVPGKGSASSSATTVVTTFKNKDVDAIAKADNVQSLYSYVTGQEVIKYEGTAKSVLIFGYSANAPLIEDIPIATGRFYTEDEEDSVAPVIVLGSKLKRDLFGDDDAIGKRVYVRGIPLKVVGILKDRGSSFGFDMDSIVYIPTVFMQKRFLGTDYVMGVSLSVKDPDRIDQTKSDLEELMMDRHDITDPDENDFEVMTMADAADMVDSVISAITLLLAVLAAVSLVVGGVGITNIMYVSVIERTFEVGLRRAVGARKKDILWQFLLEATILTFLGGVAGVLLGAIVAFLIYYAAVSYGLDWSYSLSLSSVLASLIFSAIIGLFFGVYPAQKAANMDPIEALRQD